VEGDQRAAAIPLGALRRDVEHALVGQIGILALGAIGVLVEDVNLPARRLRRLFRRGAVERFQHGVGGIEAAGSDVGRLGGGAGHALVERGPGVADVALGVPDQFHAGHRRLLHFALQRLVDGIGSARHDLLHGDIGNAVHHPNPVAVQAIERCDLSGLGQRFRALGELHHVGSIRLALHAAPQRGGKIPLGAAVGRSGDQAGTEQTVGKGEVRLLGHGGTRRDAGHGHPARIERKRRQVALGSARAAAPGHRGHQDRGRQDSEGRHGIGSHRRSPAKKRAAARPEGLSYVLREIRNRSGPTGTPGAVRRRTRSSRPARR